MLTQQLTQPVYHVISSHGFGEIREDEASLAKAFFSLKDFSPGDLLSAFSAAAILKEPTYLTVQVGEDEHIHLSPEFLQYINHSCEPNILFNTDTMQLECLQDIKAGDELCFFYPATEWNMAQPFECLCGTESCIKQVQGAMHVSKEVIKNYKLTAFIQSMLNK
jgi:SET domain-containing protein